MKPLILLAGIVLAAQAVGAGMSLYFLIAIIVMLGVIAWAIHTFAPIDARIKTLIVWLLVIVAVVIMLEATGVCATLKTITTPTI